MSNVSNTNGSNAINVYTNYGTEQSGSSLTPEALLLYCSSRMEAIQTNINQFFADQQGINKKSAELGKVLELARQNGPQNPADLDGDYGQEEKNQIAVRDRANSLVDLYRTLDTDEAKAACAREFEVLTGRSIGDFAPAGADPVGTNTIKDASRDKLLKPTTQLDVDERLSNIKDAQSKLSKDGELNMIQLQALVSQRQLAVQLTTQLMQTVHEASKGVIGNIR